MKKTILAIGLGAMLSITATGAMAMGKLTLQSVNEPNNINVYCGSTQATEKNTGLPIIAGSPRILPYVLIKALLGSPIVCDFYEGKRSAAGTDIATTSFTINSPNLATVTSYQQLASGFTISPITVNVPQKSITVTLTKN